MPFICCLPPRRTQSRHRTFFLWQRWRQPRRLAQRPSGNKRKTSTERGHQSKWCGWQDTANQSLPGSSLSVNLPADPSQLCYGIGHPKHPQFNGAPQVFKAQTAVRKAERESREVLPLYEILRVQLFSSKTRLLPRNCCQSSHWVCNFLYKDKIELLQRMLFQDC